MGEAVRVENFSFRYSEGSKYAVKNFNLRVREGEIVILAGPSGCGKPTLLRSINGRIPTCIRGLRRLSIGRRPRREEYANERPRPESWAAISEPGEPDLHVFRWSEISPSGWRASECPPMR